MARQLITNAHDPLHESRQARLKLASEGELPLGMLRDEIDASWRRSLGHGLDCLQGEQVGLGLEQGHDLRMLLERNRLLVDAVTPELDYLVARQGKAGIVILGDAQANVLAIEGQTHVLSREGLRDLHPGSCWSESLRGTNAIGTAVVEGRPTLINCGEHYLDRLSPFSCTSVPLRDPRGEVIGVLDITREGVMAQPQDSLSTLMLAAGNIESRMFGLCHPEQLVLAFHSRPQYLNSAWHGLLALSLDGEVLAANDSACQLLQVPRHELVGRRSTDLLGERSPAFIARLWQGGVSSVQTAKGEFYFRALQLPRHGRLNGSTPASKPALGKQSPALDALAGADP
ncbi:MAG: sigma-54-dependent Fis family transcriptional regulator, partial [Pseudomonas putida]